MKATSPTTNRTAPTITTETHEPDEDDEGERIVRANKSPAEASVRRRKQATLKKTRLFIE
jgi:hypothetical protein